ncbi:hypothetical protein E2C01_056656 [Portunus trituberculatus]|uniref:Uncharacterized protein n=1 Tax=Portunus trituberculatus TaxID=210409 RepID=A0A5B7GRE6_PORTR|nr:hypothetical protein [Portunus trituberculatus]
MGHSRITQSYRMSQKIEHYYCDEYFVPLTVRHFLVECHSLVELTVRISRSLTRRASRKLSTEYDLCLADPDAHRWYFIVKSSGVVHILKRKLKVFIFNDRVYNFTVFYF